MGICKTWNYALNKTWGIHCAKCKTCTKNGTSLSIYIYFAQEIDCVVLLSIVRHPSLHFLVVFSVHFDISDMLIALGIFVPLTDDFVASELWP